MSFDLYPENGGYPPLKEWNDVCAVDPIAGARLIGRLMFVGSKKDGLTESSYDQLYNSPLYHFPFNGWVAIYAVKHPSKAPNSYPREVDVIALVFGDNSKFNLLLSEALRRFSYI